MNILPTTYIRSVVNKRLIMSILDMRFSFFSERNAEIGGKKLLSVVRCLIVIT